MKITCNSLLEGPLITLIKLHDSLNVKGVCGILTEGSKHNVKHTTIGAMQLLSFCNDLVVSEEFSDTLKILDINIPKGPLNYFNIANASSGVLLVPPTLTEEPVAMATSDIKFKLLIGSTSTDKILTESDVFTHVTNARLSGYEFTALPLPLMTKNVLKFNVTSVDGFSTIQCDEVTNQDVAALFSDIKVE